jgi:serine/threonine protein kinase
MGDVYLAEDTRLAGRQCAIKAMSPAALPAQDRNWAITAFKQEAQMLAALRHPGLTPVTDFFPERGSWYLVMEYINGLTLDERLQQMPGRRLPPPEALSVIYQLCDVLDYLHRQTPPVIFRDLKPGNVMLTPQGEVKLIDFGIARFFKPGKTQDTVNLGTPGYCAPEQHGGSSQTDARSDVYSLGVVLHQILTGHDPTTTIFSLPPARSLNPAIPYAGEGVIARATQLDPAARFQTVLAFKQALFMATPTPTQLAPVPPTVSAANLPTMVIPTMPIVPPRPNSYVRPLAALAALIVIGLGAAMISPPPDATPTPALPTASPSPTDTVEPTATASATASAGPTVTPQSETPTPTLRPSATWRPTSTPRPTPVDVTIQDCNVTGPFANLWAQLQSRLDCASGSAQTVQGAAQVFERGRMYWRGDNLVIYAVMKGGRWEAYSDRWVEGSPDYSCQADTPGVPVRGFGRVWCDQSSVRSGVGNAAAGEYALDITVQQFAGGLIMQTDDRVLVLYNDGSWERH